MERIVNLQWDVKCREEDLVHRELENERRKIDDARRKIDEKAQQLRSISNQSALIAGFSMVVLVESRLDGDPCAPLLVLFGFSAASVVALMLTAMINATFVYVAIWRYDTVKRDISFENFWINRCEEDWRLAFNCFSLGVMDFTIMLAIVGWVTFKSEEEDTPAYNIVSSLISSVAFVVLLVFMRTHRKWSDWLIRPICSDETSTSETRNIESVDE